MEGGENLGALTSALAVSGLRAAVHLPVKSVSSLHGTKNYL